MKLSRSARNTYLREAATQFPDFLSHNNMTSTHSINMFAEATADTWTSNNTNFSHTIDYVAVKDEDAAGIVSAATVPSVDNGHMVQDHVLSAVTFTCQATADNFRPHCKRVRVTKARVEDSTDRENFTNGLAKIPTAAWHIPLDQHY